MANGNAISFQTPTVVFHRVLVPFLHCSTILMKPLSLLKRTSLRFVKMTMQKNANLYLSYIQVNESFELNFRPEYCNHQSCANPIQIRSDHIRSDLGTKIFISDRIGLEKLFGW